MLNVFIEGFGFSSDCIRIIYLLLYRGRKNV